MAQTIIEMPNAEAFERGLGSDLGQAKAHGIVQQAGVRYADLYVGRTHYEHRALCQHLEENILPGVALYQTLLADDGTREGALQFMERALRETSVPGRQQMERLGRLPFYYGLLRVLIKPIMRLNFPEQGWKREWVETSGDVIAFDMKSCFYLDVLEGYGVPELTAQYCAMDDFTYDGVSPHVRWARTQTLGRGDGYCNFRFEHVRRQ